MHGPRTRRVAAALLAATLTAGIGPAAAAPRLHSDPGGARVEVRGPVSLSGSTPLPLDGLPNGRYRLTLDGAGLPSVHGRLDRRAGGILTVSRDNGAGALLYPPGWTHLRQDERARGMLFLGAGVGFGVGALIQEFARADASDERDAAFRVYGDAVSEDALLEARIDLLDADSRAADAAEIRDLWTAAAAAVWIGSALEAWILTPAPTLRSTGDGEYVLLASRANAFGAGFRSFLVPGAGQRYMGHEARGNRFTAAVTLLGAASLAAHGAFLDGRRDQEAAQRRYDLADTENEAERRRRELEAAADDADTLERLRWGLLGVTAAVHLWNIIDAAGLVGRDAAPDGFGWRLAPERDGFRAALTWRM